VIIPSKTVCQQRVSTFFIVTTPDTLLEQPVREPAPAANTTPKPGYSIPAGGTDMLELQLKTPGRIIENPELSSLLDLRALALSLNTWSLTAHIPQ
jgi:hypothetical protein